MVIIYCGWRASLAPCGIVRLQRDGCEDVVIMTAGHKSFRVSSLSFLAGGSKPVKRLDLFPVLLPQKILQLNNYKKVYNKQHKRQQQRDNDV